MPVDIWFILALIMIFSSILLCGILPMIIRLLNARKRYFRYLVEMNDIECSNPDAFLSLQSIYPDGQRLNHEQPIISHGRSFNYSNIPFIDDEETPV